MKLNISKSDSVAAKEIWAIVGRVAARTPDWVKEHVSMASEGTVNHLKERKQDASSRSKR